MQLDLQPGVMPGDKRKLPPELYNLVDRQIDGQRAGLSWYDVLGRVTSVVAQAEGNDRSNLKVEVDRLLGVVQQVVWLLDYLHLCR